MGKYILDNLKLIKEDSLKIGLRNRSFLYGDGFFESIRVINKKTINLYYHQKRIEKSLKYLMFDLNIDFTNFNEKLEELIKKNNIADGIIKVIVFRDSLGKYFPFSNKSRIIIQSQKCNNTFNEVNKGLKLGLFLNEKKIAGVISNFKTTSSILYVLASIYSKKNNFDDVLILNNDNLVIESTNSNLFIFKQNKLITPPISDGCIDGTFRSFIVENFNVIEKSITLDEINEADELFLTNSVSGIRRVGKFLKRRYESKELTNNLLKEALDYLYLQS
tara:strand:+ start:291 stop:1118 length:828 start_codon:yes stop_codon:yes gene_type:complete